MPRPPRRLMLAAALTVVALALAGCTPGADPADGRIAVVASTNVYGQIAEAIGGDLVEVTSIIASASQDPHSYEASAQDQLRVRKADLVIENGGGYDPFIDALIEATDTDAPVLTAVQFSSQWEGGAAHDDSDGDDHGHDHVEGFNEHVWYDVSAMGALAIGVSAKLEVLRPADASTFEANLATFTAGIAQLEQGLADLDAVHGGAQVFATEPVPGYLLAAAGLVDVTPPAFSQAVEEGQDVPAATLLEALKLLRSGSVEVVAANAQTGGAETTQVIDEAQGLGIPVVEFTETLPDGSTFLEWMQANIDALSKALGA